ncbi:MAG: hypothetical protein EOO77_05105, partial [Oxalobacteraceae bacterium]
LYDVALADLDSALQRFPAHHDLEYQRATLLERAGRKKESVAAFKAALATGRRVTGMPGDVYLLDASVLVPGGREIVGNGASLKLGHKVIGLLLENDRCMVRGWTIMGGGGLYAVLNTGRFNTFADNLCTGDIGHFFFSSNAEHVVVTGNRVNGMSANSEITTAFLVEKSRHIILADNKFWQIPVGWSIQVRGGSEDFAISRNEFLQTQWSDVMIASEGQTVFRFTLGSSCHLKKIQVNGKPLSVGYTIQGQGPAYLVTFKSGRKAGENIKLVGYRGAENIQINGESKNGTITENRIDGTGDSGIICLGSYLHVSKNIVRNCGYAGIAIYGGQNYITISDNIIADCAQMDDGLSSPDDPKQASVFAGAILASGEDATITGNTIKNTGGTMRYAIRINKTDMTLRSDGSAAITITDNRYEGDFSDGRVFAPNDTSGARINSIVVDGPLITYPGEIDLNPAWTNAPPSGRHIRTSGFGQTWAIRDTVTRTPGKASLKTVAGEYVDFSLSDSAVLRGCNVRISFWAKATSGSSYFSVFTILAGLPFPLTATITDTAWKRYFISFPLTANLADTILIRCGATGGSANIQNIEIVGHQL